MLCLRAYPSVARVGSSSIVSVTVVPRSTFVPATMLWATTAPLSAPVNTHFRPAF